MMIELENTTSSAIAAAFVRARERAGSPAMGMVMTLIIVVPDEDAQSVMAAAQKASREHPARVLCVILGERRGTGSVAAQVSTGDGWGGETAVIHLRGQVVGHAESVVLPLLLPDSPVVVWWPTNPPPHPAEDPLGALAQRRITDASTATRGRRTRILDLCRSHCPGDTDLSWTRLTAWRALLAAALDQHPLKVTRASISAEKFSPSADLLAAWLNDRLGVPVDRHTSTGPGITEVLLQTGQGPIKISRSDGKLATFTSPGRPDRPVALKRRPLPELLAEELRHLDNDEVYAAVTKRVIVLAEE